MVITIGITPVLQIQTTLVGSLQVRLSQSTIHVLQVGVFLMAEMMVFGQRPRFHFHTLNILKTIPTKALTSPASMDPQIPSGTQLRVVAITTMAASLTSVTTAAIGLHLPSTVLRTIWDSTSVVTSVYYSVPCVQAVSRSVASENSFESVLPGTQPCWLPVTRFAPFLVASSLWKQFF